MAASEARDVALTARRLLVDLMRVYTSPVHVEHFLARNRGLRVPLPWPRGAYLCVADQYQPGMPDEATLRQWESLLCCPEDLTVVGTVRFPAASDGDSVDALARPVDAEPDPRPEPVIACLGAGGRVYAGRASDATQVCRVGDTLEGFLKRGLRRMDDTYRQASELALELPPRCDLAHVKSRLDLLRYRDSHPSAEFALTVPEGDTVRMWRRADDDHDDGDDNARFAASSSSSSFAQRLVRDMDKFATCGPGYFVGQGRSSLYVDRAGGIYCFNDSGPGDLVRLADGFQHFLRIGMRAQAKNYTFFGTAAARAERRPVMCPHTSAFRAKTASVARKDLLLERYWQERECAEARAAAAISH